MNNKNLISLNKITFYYSPDSPILDDFSLEINSGDIVIIAGPSGCGKTTLLSLIVGLLKPQKGDVFLLGEKITSRYDIHFSNFRKKYVGFVFQDFALVPYMSVIENVLLPVYISKSFNASYHRRAEELLERLGILQYKDELPTKLSGGQQQRVGIARALIKSPFLLVADEPTAELDNNNALNILKMLKEYREEHPEMAVVIATHQLELFGILKPKVIYLA